MRLEYSKRMKAISGGLSRMTALAWFIAGFGTAIGIVIVLAVWVDVAFIDASTPTISYRVIVATCWQPALASVLTAVLVIPPAILIGHLFVPQVIRPDGNGSKFRGGDHAEA